MVQDPVCGMQIGEGEAAGKVGYCGMAYYFCSVFCLAAFVENPEKYTLREERTLQRHYPQREGSDVKISQRA